VDWVLSRFTPEERRVLSYAIPRAVDAIETFLREGVERAMSLYNARDAIQQVELNEQEHTPRRAESQSAGADEGGSKSEGSESVRGEGWAERVRRIIREGVGGK
jgi:hypothetical protein